MTGAERLTLDRVLTEIVNLRRDFSGEITGLRLEVNNHFEKLDEHLTDQDVRLRIVEIATAESKAAEDAREKAKAERVKIVAERSISKRWIITTLVATVSVIVGLLTFVAPIIKTILGWPDL